MILLYFIQEELSKRGDHRVVSFDEKHQPDVDWCLYSVSALNPQHHIFDPDYLPAKSQRGRRGVKYIPKAEDFIFLDQANVRSGQPGTGPNCSNAVAALQAFRVVSDRTAPQVQPCRLGLAAASTLLPAFFKNNFDGSKHNWEINKERNVTFQQYGAKATFDHSVPDENKDSIDSRSRKKGNEYFASQNVNHFDLSLDESVPYLYIQSNAYSKKKTDPQSYEEEKTYDEDIVSIRKFKKSQTEKKSNKVAAKQQEIAPSQKEQISTEKIGGLFQMLQNLEKRGLLPQEMQPYLEYYCQNNHTQNADFTTMPNLAHTNPSFEPTSTFILPRHYDERVFPNQTKRVLKKKSLHLENKRSVSVHTSASSETRFLDFQGDQFIAHEQTKFCEALESKSVAMQSLQVPCLRKSFNRLDIVMKDESKKEEKSELINVLLNQIHSEAPADHNSSQLNEPIQSQIYVGAKAEGEDETVFEESSQIYADRKISQLFNI